MSESLASAAPASRPVHGVVRSVCGRPWLERLDSASSLIAAAISQTHGVPDVVARVLAGRGVSVQTAPGFLAPRLRDLMPDPSRLTDMDAAVARLADAVQRGERVAIFGDYDVDGACSAALLAEYLRDCGLAAPIHIPDRITEGYGPNVEAMRSLAGEGASLIVTVDCGTAGQGPLEEAARLGVDVVVLDHHGAPERLPPAAAIVNPNRLDDLSGLGHLCAASVVFMTLVALSRELRRRGFWQGRPEPDLLAALDLVALATVADVVPLIGLNRAFVRQGLAVMRSRRRLGLAALIDAARVETAPECWHLGYCLGPRINAGGRIGDSSLGARLLITQDPGTAGTIAATLERLNEERRAIEARAVEEAEAEAAKRLDAEPDAPVLVLASPDWHPGIVGLVAARVKERFGRPVFAFARKPDGTATGSGRSVPGADLGRAVRLAAEAGAAIKGGGHAMAAGATVLARDLDRFREAIAAALPARSAGEPADPLLVDAALSAGGASAETVRALESAGPFGQGQPEPVFAFGQHRVAEARQVGQNHVRALLKSGDGSSLRAVAFRAADKPLGRALLDAVGRPIHVAGTLCIDRWGGGERVELRILDAAIPG
ncbi:single-stranded-DNA-specific exonuclease RecJ [Enterovirga aerilata]|uniref:Single-stranded-DNA-specific exonuclease RecJ n=1 Tax=Enterovirga aerilata TaxID=2730920 RepID=A0A849IFE6_9HYPH|nr:single-stranded-DNA-specific exonuclease RecJ [Enterovirga sp. DB1703]NNM74687.1 single-stranded-DNA-specific exonuclease RecJ [Enterovirga sp. DB1703]